MKEHLPGILAPVGAIAGIAFTNAICRRLFPYRPQLGEALESPSRSAELARKYRWVDPVLSLPVLFFAGACCWLWSRGLLSLAAWRAESLPPGRFLIQPTWVVWMLPSLFLGIVSAILPIDLLCRLMLRRDYGEYMRFSRSGLGFDARKVTIGLVVAVLIAAVGFVALGSNWHLGLADDSIAWRRFWSLSEQRYLYSEVDKLVETSHVRRPLGNVQERTSFYIVFMDGQVWRDEEMGRDPWGSEQDVRILAFLEERSGKRVMHAQLIEDARP